MIGAKLTEEDLQDCLQNALLYTLRKWNVIEGKEHNVVKYCIAKYENLQRDLIKSRQTEKKLRILFFNNNN